MFDKFIPEVWFIEKWSIHFCFVKMPIIIISQVLFESSTEKLFYKLFKACHFFQACNADQHSGQQKLLTLMPLIF